RDRAIARRRIRPADRSPGKGSGSEADRVNGFVAVFRKELTQMIRDRMTLFFSIMVPVFELILFGVIDMNAKNIPTVVLDLSRTQESRHLIDQFENTSYQRMTGEGTTRAE